MRTDSLFYSLFQISPQLLFELLGQSPALAAGYEFHSIEIKQPDFRIDGVFLPPETEPELLLYFAEVQFQRKEDFYRKLFAEVFLYLYQKNPPQDWQAVALFETRSLDPGLPRQYQALEADYLRVVYLDELEESPEESTGAALVHLIVAEEREAIGQAQRVVSRLREQATDRELMELAETILIYKFPRMSEEELKEMFQIEDLKETRVYQDAFHAGEIRGIEQGIEQGIERGVQGVQDTLLEILTERFGNVPQQVRRQIQEERSIDRLRDLCRAAINATSLDAFMQRTA